MSLTSDPVEIQRALAALLAKDQVTELRLLRARPAGYRAPVTMSGFFSDSGDLAREARIHTDTANPQGAYFVPNPVDPALLSRFKPNQLRVVGKEEDLTGDADILCRRWLLCDFDPVRKRGISSTGAEHNLSLDRAWKVRDKLLGEGWPEPLLIDSGNGTHLLWRVELPCEDGELIKKCLQALAMRFDDSAVKIDRVVFNAARIWKLPGTPARKGTDTPERPHRLSCVLELPDPLAPVPRELLEQLAAGAPPEKSAGPSGVAGKPFGLADWIQEHKDKLEVKGGPSGYKGGLRWRLERCPFDGQHGGDAAIFQGADGAPGFHCLHNGCFGRGWKELRALIEPGKKRGAGGAKDLYTRDVAYALEAENRFARDGGQKLYIYQGGVYRAHGERFVKTRIRGLLESWGKEASWSSQLGNEVTEFITVAAPDLWSEPSQETLNLKNGLLGIKHRQLRPHSPDFLSSIQLPVSFDPQAECPVWDAITGEIFPEDCVEARTAFEIAAMLLVPRLGIDRTVLLLGGGGNGKSAYLTALTALLGESNVSNVTLQHLEADKFSVVRLLGRLANIAADLPAEHLESTSTFKTITGRDRIAAQYKFKPMFEFTPLARLLFSANSPPRSKDDSEGFFDRWLVINFERKFRGSGGEITRKELDAMLAHPRELSGVLNRCLELLPGVIARNGPIETPSMIAAREQFQQTTDYFAIWLAQNTVEDPLGATFKEELFNSYNRDRERDNLPTKPDDSIGRDFKRLRPATGMRQWSCKDDSGNTRRRRAYLGIRLRTKDEGGQ